MVLAMIIMISTVALYGTCRWVRSLFPPKDSKKTRQGSSSNAEWMSLQPLPPWEVVTQLEQTWGKSLLRISVGIFILTSSFIILLPYSIDWDSIVFLLVLYNMDSHGFAISFLLWAQFEPCLVRNRPPLLGVWGCRACGALAQGTPSRNNSLRKEQLCFLDC